KDEEKAEKLLNIVSESTAKHQVILESVLEKVPEEAKEAILNAIEASKKGYEQALRQVAELRRENEQLKKDIEELKSDNENDNENENETEEISEKSESKIKQAKYETETAHAKAEAEKYKLEAEQTKLEMEKLKKENEAQKQKVETQTEAKKNEAKTKHTIFTLPSGAVIEMDENGNFIKTIQEAPIISTTPAEQTQTTQQKMTINRKTEQTEQDDHEFVILSFIPVYANVDYEIPPNQQLNHYKMEIQFGDKKNSFNNIEGNLKICLENSKMQGTTYINGQQYSSSNISIYDNFTENELILTNPFVFKNNLIRLPETADEYDNYLLTAIYKDQKYIIKLSQYINFEIRPECEQIIIDYQNDERINKYKSHYKIKETIQKELQKIKNQYYSKMTTEKCYTSLRYQTLPRHQSGKI
ncbi:MAG: hypothetical protein KAV41_01685, partial [Candidatus Pacebacteria bacterium]|nr:hypothetical protein [Candidatus Paceibacterota bacterium]